MIEIKLSLKKLMVCVRAHVWIKFKHFVLTAFLVLCDIVDTELGLVRFRTVMRNRKEQLF